MAKDKIVKMPNAVGDTNWISHTLLIGMQIGAVTLKKSLTISYKVKQLTCDLAIVLLDVIPEKPMLAQKHVHRHS